MFYRITKQSEIFFLYCIFVCVFLIQFDFGEIDKFSRLAD